MPDSRLDELAAAAGVARSWRDVGGRDQRVGDDALRVVLAALGYPAGTRGEIATGLEAIAEQGRRCPAMIVSQVGCPVALPFAAERIELIAEDGSARQAECVDGILIAPAEPGYYRLAQRGGELTLAVAPAAFPCLADFAARPMWGPAIQIPALRGDDPQPFGNFRHLADAVETFARRGADAVAINPVHALFSGNGQGYSPYSPSSRLFLNAAMADPAALGLPPLELDAGGALIDWEAALPCHLQGLRAVFKALPADLRTRADAFADAGGEALARHALYNALDGRFRPGGADGWRDWPAAFHDPDAAEARRYAAEHTDEIAFHTFVQWLARQGLVQAAQRARDAGMAIGLIADLAVGVHTGGSDTWGGRAAMLQGLTIGAPPDPLGPQGQNWNLTGYSPQGLRANGFAPWIALLRASLAGVGGLRIDHAFGLARLWVIPHHGGSADGAYLSYPFAELLALAALEAWRAKALIIGEDLGTAPPGFGEAIAQRQLPGMRVLWFERAADQGFIAGRDYPANSVAMTGTHDTATVAGWWRARDLEWNAALGRFAQGSDRAREEAARDWDRGLLWAALGKDAPRPPSDQPERALDAALDHVGGCAAQLVIAPLEDLLALDEQPNLPGTIGEHPNWRRRLSAPLETLLDQPDNARRIARLHEARVPGCCPETGQPSA